MSQEKSSKKKNPTPKFNLSWIYIAVFVGLLGLQFASSNYSAAARDSNFNDLAAKLLKGHVEKV
ncbi:MAG: hypothetical protein EBZ31_06565, partial [Flavobacteriia bacterium]|nr:hypothetical protein [Flavobacteriia bacterium]